MVQRQNLCTSSSHERAAFHHLDPFEGQLPEPSSTAASNASHGSLPSFTIELDCSVLDVHFHPLERRVFAASTSDGKVGLFRWQANPMRLDHISWWDVSAGSDALATSLTWVKSFDIDSQNEPSIALAVTLTDGCVRLYAGDTERILSGKTCLVRSFQSHSQEAWYVALSCTFDILLSGGDDMALRVYKLGDIDQSESAEEVTPVWTDYKSHGAGVTAILPLEQILSPSGSSYVLTGSYDECVRVFKLDQAPKKRPVAEESLGGGVWRLKQIGDSWSESSSSDFEGQRICTLVLASCMHAGVRVLQVMRTCEKGCLHDSCTWTIDVVARFEEHDSMNYASDVRMANGKPQIVSTSFYDKRLCLWSLEDWSLGQNALTAAEVTRMRMKDDVSD
ncbi:MAG: hypothetical protein Q9160_007120 [Pyrenula sp. 1 TL-2023]